VASRVSSRTLIGRVDEPRQLVGDEMRVVAWALALPEKVVTARPTGVGHALTAYRMPIEGRDEWIAAARRLA